MCDYDKCCEKFRLRRAFSTFVYQFISHFRYLFVCDCDKCRKKNSPAAGFRHSCISTSFRISLIICVRLWQMLWKISPAAGFRHSCISISFTIPLIICGRQWQILSKKFACGGLSPLLYFNFLQDFTDHLYTTVTNAVKNFACSGLSPLLHFNFYSSPPITLDNLELWLRPITSNCVTGGRRCF